jgi:serine protease Do
MKLPYRSLSLVAGLLFAQLAPITAAPEQAPAQSAPLITGLGDLKQLDHKLVALADKTTAATVSLVSTRGGGSGSGVIVSRDGLILSAAHVVAALSGDVIVLFSDGKRATAKALGADFDRDAAMLQITDPGEYPWCEPAAPEPLPVNTWCVAVGHPGGFDPLRTPPLRLGRILAYGNFIVTDSTVVSGDSGGPLFDVEGRVIGIHSNIGMGLGENRHVPIKLFRDKWDDLLAGKRSGDRFNKKPGERKPQPAKTPEAAPPAFGLKLGAEGPAGITIAEVMKDSAAAKAGLKAGDVVVRLAGRKVTSAKEFATALDQPKSRPRVILAYRRDDKILRARLPYPAAAQPKPAAAKATATQDELNALIDKCLAEAKDGKAQLKLTPQQLEKFGGMEEFQKQLKERLASKRAAAAEPKVEDKPTPPAPKSEKELADLFAKLRQRAQANGGRLQISPEDLRNLGGIDEVRKRLRSAPAAPDAFFMSVLAALKTVARDASGATVSVLADGKAVALGTVVTADGGILTKDSETAKGAVSVKAGVHTYPATLVKRFPAWDLALFHIKADGLSPVSFDPASSPVRGNLLTVPGPGSEPLGVGLVSVNSRPLGQIGFLGIESDRTAMTRGSVLVKAVTKDGAADKAGIKSGDLITSINGEAVTDPLGFTQSIVRFKPNDLVRFDVRRGEEKLTLEAKLGERPVRKMGREFQKVNEMSGPLSPRIDGFPLALQHDIPLEPSQCGGPLLDLDGRCVGLNVARAGRVNTLAIPAAKLADLLAEARPDLAAATAKAAKADKPAKADDPVTAEDIAEVTKALEDVHRRLKQLEKRLEPAPAH